MRHEGVAKSQSLRVAKVVLPRSLRLCDLATLRLLVAVLIALPAFANITSSSLTGRVIVGGAPAAGVTVTATSTALQQPRTTITNASGRYWLGALPPGTYDVTFSLAGHTTLTKRAVLELARVARVDATLEPNPDEDSTTSTATTVSVADTIAITAHFDDRMLDRMPQGRIGTALLGPGSHFGYLSILDGMGTSGFVTSEETIEQIAFVRGAPPAEWDTFVGTAIPALTRSGGEEFSFTLRDTIARDEDDDLLHFGEATVGGRVVPQRLWFFAAGWTGQQDYPFRGEQRGTMVKLDAQIGAAHHFDASYNDTEQGPGFQAFESDTASLRYTAAIGPRFTSEVVAGRTTTRFDGFDTSTEYFSGRASYSLGDHLLTAGLSGQDSDVPDSRSLFVSDRWSYSRWNAYAGLRYDDGPFDERVAPRIALTYDLRGDGRRALSASWGEYASAAQPQFALRTSTLGYATAIGNSGAARIDALRREDGDFWMNELQLDARYRLFDRFEAGATYTFVDQYESGFQQPAYPQHAAHVWAGAELPVGSHEFGVTLLQHYLEFADSIYQTDLALRYSIPFTRLGLMIAADAANVLDSDQIYQAPRAVRLWIRVRV